MRINDPGKYMWHQKCRWGPNQQQRDLQLSISSSIWLMHDNPIPKGIWG